MADLRASKKGLAKEAQEKIESNFNVAEALKCLNWIKNLIGDQFTIVDSTEKDLVKDNLYNVLKDGIVLCKLVNHLLPDDRKLDNKKTFDVPSNAAFKTAKERERIGIFLDFVVEYGVPETNKFQTDDLYEKSNLAQVCICIGALGMEAQSRPTYVGPKVWPKIATPNERDFTTEQIVAGKQIINLQYGTNKGANQAGMNFGKPRKIMD